jgi:hypothetical protein
MRMKSSKAYCPSCVVTDIHGSTLYTKSNIKHTRKGKKHNEEEENEQGEEEEEEVEEVCSVLQAY